MNPQNKIIDENHSCTFCWSTDKPIPDGDVIRCPSCNLPQFEGVTLETDISIKELNCSICRRPVKPRTQVRINDGLVASILWTCSECGNDNRTQDNLGILEAEIINEGDF